MIVDLVRLLKFEIEEIAAEYGILGPFYRPSIERRLMHSGLLLIHVPRNGGTSFAKALGLPLSAHHSAKFYASILGQRFDEINSISIVRDPIDRFISSYHFVINDGAEHIRLNSVYRFLTRNVKSIDDYINYLWERRDHINRLDPVMRQQSFFILDSQGEPLPNCIGTVDVVANMLHEIGYPKVPHLNRSARQDITLTADQIARVRQLYAEDFRLYEAYISAEKRPAGLSAPIQLLARKQTG